MAFYNWEINVYLNFFKISPWKVKKGKDGNTTKSKKDSTYQSLDTSEEETEEDKLRQRREEQRINCMKFCKVYNLGFNTIEISYFPCA